MMCIYAQSQKHIDNYTIENLKQSLSKGILILQKSGLQPKTTNQEQ